MDELLALMADDDVDVNDDSALVPDGDRDSEDDSFVPTERIQKKVVPTVDSFLGKDRGGADSRNSAANRYNTKKTRVSSSNSKKSSSNPHNTATHLAKASVDDRLGIRMTNRLMSSIDLSELVDDYDYFSPSVLSAMTLKRLNSLLQDPSPIIDPATVAGKTESLVTIGIVFSNSGTRISSKGGAFCVLTIGNLNSGPCLTVFLFGEAYGKYCVSCKPGKVVAAMAPKLLPAARGDAVGKNNRSSSGADHTVSFSVYDAGQFKMVANARDYGTCKATTNRRVKQPNGTWKSMGPQPCKNYVDKRHSEYCEYHRKQEQRNAAGGTKMGNRFQQVKTSHHQAAAILVPSASRNRAPMSSRGNRFLGQNAAAKNNPSGTIAPTPAGAPGASTSAIGVGRGNVPMHMTKQPQPSRFSSESNSVKKLQARREGGSKTTRSSSDPSCAARLSKKPPSSGDWLGEAKATGKKRGPSHINGRVGFSLSHFAKKPGAARSGSTGTTGPKSTGGTANTTKRARTVNTVGEGFDGSVLVPKPSKLFQQSSAPVEAHERRIVTPTNDPKRTETLRQQQAEVARRLQEGGGNETLTNNGRPGTSHKNPYSKHSGNGRTKNNKNSEDADDFLAAMGGKVDTEKVRNARSKFADEVDADEYANSRRKIVELEKLEASQEARNKKKNKKSGSLLKTYVCNNCKRKFNLKPMGCIRSHHSVKCEYNLKDPTTKDQRRNELHKKSVQDGGLHLGSGIEWRNTGFSVGYSRFNH